MTPSVGPVLRVQWTSTLIRVRMSTTPSVKSVLAKSAPIWISVFATGLVPPTITPNALPVHHAPSGITLKSRVLETAPTTRVRVATVVKRAFTPPLVCAMDMDTKTSIPK
jgi:hypothetical protein